jgi:hypothetical protein
MHLLRNVRWDGNTIMNDESQIIWKEAYVEVASQNSGYTKAEIKSGYSPNSSRTKYLWTKPVGTIILTTKYCYKEKLYLCLSITSWRREGGGKTPRIFKLNIRWRKEPPGTRSVWDWVRPTSGLNTVTKRKILSPARDLTPVPQPGISHFTDSDIPAIGTHILSFQLRFSLLGFLYRNIHPLTFPFKSHNKQAYAERISQTINRLITSYLTRTKYPSFII